MKKLLVFLFVLSLLSPLGRTAFSRSSFCLRSAGASACLMTGSPFCSREMKMPVHTCGMRCMGRMPAMGKMACCRSGARSSCCCLKKPSKSNFVLSFVHIFEIGVHFYSFIPIGKEQTVLYSQKRSFEQSLPPPCFSRPPPLG
jgi:hypothetical protein